MEELYEKQLKELNGGYTIKLSDSNGIYFLNLDTGTVTNILGNVVYQYQW